MSKKASPYYLGFDFGLKRIGVAIGQLITQTASPLVLLKAEQGLPVWEEVLELVNTWKPKALIVGLPLDSNSQDYIITHCARKFGNRLHAKSRLPVFFVDEILSTKMAKNLLREGVGSTPVDCAAACLILEDWLKSQPNPQ